MLQSDNAKLLFLQSDKSKNSWLWVVGFIWGAPDAHLNINSSLIYSEFKNDEGERHERIEHL
jgi:hypothetical protein